MAVENKSFADALNDQIANEFGAAMQYIGIAVHYDAETLPRLATFFYRQALEERSHAMMMIQYLLDVDEEVRIPDIPGVDTRFSDDVAPVRMALEQEKRVGEEIYRLSSSPGKRATTGPSSSCSGSSRNRWRRSR